MTTKGQTYDSYDSLEIRVKDEVATIRLFNLPQHMKIREQGGQPEVHWELGSVLARLREDDGVRVVIITGAEDGVPLLAAGRPMEGPSPYETMGIQIPDPHFRAFMGLVRAHQMLAEMEKPVVARVNGDAVGFAQSIMFNCDIIVAWEDARILDHHMGMERTGLPLAVVPGDGGAALVPLYMSPARAMEYLMLAKEYKASELERLGIINYAVPMDRLDEVVDDIVARLLQRSAYALALTKRVVKRRVVDHLNLTLDASFAFEWVNFLHFQGTGGKDVKSLR